MFVCDYCGLVLPLQDLAYSDRLGYVCDGCDGEAR